MQQTITIPRQLTREGELIIISRREYNDLLGTSKKSVRKTKLDKDLDEAIKEYKQGKATGPFSSVHELRKALEK